MTPPFIIFSRSHFAAIGSVVLLVALALVILHKRSERQDDQRFQHWLALIIICNAVGWKFAEIMSADFNLADDLPLHVCGVAPYLAAAYLWKPRQQLFDVLYYWVIAGATMALLLPDLGAGYPSREFISFFITHGTPIFALLYLLLIRGARPSPKSYITALVVLNLYALFIAAPADLLFEGNYLYLRGAPPVDFSLIRYLPRFPWHIPLIEIFAYLLFRAMYLPIHLQVAAEESSRLATHKGTPRR